MKGQLRKDMKGGAPSLKEVAVKQMLVDRFPWKIGGDAMR